jgi:cyclophilin family peptidyl-prolyl cis-trans isomerase
MSVLFDALERITAERRETSRDARRALVRRIGEIGGRSQAVALTPYLRDFDPEIANEAARILGEWTGRTYVTAPTQLPRSPLPSFGELGQLANEVAVLEMRGGGRIELRLLPFEAPTNVARFARLARDGYFNGLTFHRVSRSFVIQGGSPGANEFVGDGPFTRDEVVKSSQLRGTVGISTRGRDTGDGQIFVNLVDNPRLDHNYTLIAEVVSGLDIVDGVLEGAVIERITWQPLGGRE